MAADDAGEVFLATEGTAGFGLDDSALFGGEVEDQLQGVDQVEGALHRAPYRHSFFCVVFCDHSVVFDVELFLGTGSVLAFDDEVGLFPYLVRNGGPVLLHQEGLEGVGGFAFSPDDLFFLLGLLDGVDGRELFVGDVDGGDGGWEDGSVGVG